LATVDVTSANELIPRDSICFEEIMETELGMVLSFELSREACTTISFNPIESIFSIGIFVAFIGLKTKGTAYYRNFYCIIHFLFDCIL